MIRRKAFLLAGAVWILSAVILTVACRKKEEPAPPPPPKPAPVPAVQVAKPAPERPVLPETVAELEAESETPVATAQAGFLVRQLYKEKEFVAAGDVLFLIDPATAHEQGKGDLVKITAPVAGMPAAPLRGPGDRVEAGEVLASIGKVDNVAVKFVGLHGANKKIVDFFEQLASQSGTGSARIELILPDGSVYGSSGSIEGTTETGVLSVTGIRFPNPDHVLYPGEFVKIRCVAP